MKSYGRWSLLALLTGVLAGLATAIFLISLDWATSTRELYPLIIWILPLAGLSLGWIYHQYGQDIKAGNNLILDEIHDPKKVIPLKMTPFILIGTVATHLFGGSAGREGTAVQMGASLADQLNRFFKIETIERKILLVAGAGAGFGAAIGTPLAGIVFGMEVIHVGKLKSFAWLECTIASFVAYYTSVYLGAPHSVYPKIEIPALDLKILFYILIAGIIFGLASRSFAFITHEIEGLSVKLISYPPLRPFIGGVLLVALFYLEGSYHYVGLGIQYIQQALQQPATLHEPIFKTFFSALTIGTGFKGGEFIPLVFIGTTLGSYLSIFLPVSFQLLGATGFAALFAGASNTPIACSLMAMEIFGYEIAPYAIAACFMSYLFSGNQGIYKSQIKNKKFKVLSSLQR